MVATRNHSSKVKQGSEEGGRGGQRAWHERGIADAMRKAMKDGGKEFKLILPLK